MENKDKKLPVLLSKHELHLIREDTLCPQDLVQFALAEGKGFTLKLTFDDLEEIIGYVAAEANHCKSKKLQLELDELFEKLNSILEGWNTTASES